MIGETTLEGKARLDIIRGCFARALGMDASEVAQINIATTAADLVKWDSMGHMNLILELEDTFETEFSDDIVASLGSVKAILSFVAQ